MSHIVADLRYAFRSLRRVPMFTAVAIASIALGIGANSAVFTLVDQVLLRTIPVINPAELVQVTAENSESYGGGIGNGTELSYAMYRDLRDRNETFAGMFCRFPLTLSVGAKSGSEQVAGELVSGTLFPVLGIRPVVGRLFDPGEDRAVGGSPVAVIAHSYWKSRFNGDPAVVGRTLTINRKPFEIIGVVESRFEGLDIGRAAQVYVPVTMEPQVGPPWLKIDDRRFRWVQVYGRLLPGMTRERARAGLQPLYSSLLQKEASEPAFASASQETRKRFLEGAITVRDGSRGQSGLRTALTEPLLTLLAIAGGVLLIVCANVANLLIARGAARHREIALRLAVGASRRRIVGMLLVESLALALVAAAAGLLIASWGASLLLGYYVTPDVSFAVTADPDSRIVAFTTGVGLFVAVFAGVVPALRSTRVDLVPALKSAGGGIVREQPRLRQVLVIAQVALSFTLLIAAGLFVRSLRNLLDVDPGFHTARVVSFDFDLAASGYDEARSHAFVKSMQQRLSEVPGVATVAYTFQGILSGGAWGMGFTVEGYKPPAGEEAGALCNAVSPGYFHAMGIPLLAGRDFEARDDRLVPAPQGWGYRVAVVNETFARRYFAGSNPVGRRIGIGTDPGTAMPIEIIGLAKDAKYTSLRERQRPQVFFPYLQAGTLEGVNTYLRTEQDTARIMPEVRRAIAALDPQLAIANVATLDQLVDRSIVNERLIASLSGALSAMATLLSVIGLYGVMAYLVTRRTREIGIRMALGALGRQIAGAVLRDAGRLVLVGLALGAASAIWLGRYVESQLYGVKPADAPTMIAAGVLLLVVAFVATGLPARRASRVTPMTALRED